MKFSTFVLPFVLACVSAGPGLAQTATTATAAPGALPEALKDPKAQLGYALGLRVGAQIKTMGADIDPRALALGVQDALGGARPQLSDEQIRAVMTRAQAESAARREASAKAAGEANRVAGAAFLKANAAKPGVVSLPSGLQYQVLEAGTGPKPKSTDTVECNYRGTLTDGTEFDSSAAHGGPADFPVTGVIKGWTEALQLMPVGSKWRLVVPAGLAYGEAGPSPQIGPDAVLVFEVELLSIK